MLVKHLELDQVIGLGRFPREINRTLFFEITRAFRLPVLTMLRVVNFCVVDGSFARNLGITDKHIAITDVVWITSGRLRARVRYA